MRKISRFIAVILLGMIMIGCSGNDDTTDTTTDMTYHNYEPLSGAEVLPDISSRDIALEEREYLPDDDIIVLPDESITPGRSIDVEKAFFVL